MSHLASGMQCGLSRFLTGEQTHESASLALSQMESFNRSRVRCAPASPSFGSRRFSSADGLRALADSPMTSAPQSNGTLEEVTVRVTTTRRRRFRNAAIGVVPSTIS